MRRGPAGIAAGDRRMWRAAAELAGLSLEDDWPLTPTPGEATMTRTRWLVVAAVLGLAAAGYPPAASG